MLETLHLVRKYTHIFSFRKYFSWYQDPLNFSDIIIFWQKIGLFWQKQYLHSKQQYERCLRSFLVLFLVLVRSLLMTVSFTDHESGIWLLECSKLAINPKNDNDVFLTLPCFSCQCQLLVQFSCQYHYQFWIHDTFHL